MKALICMFFVCVFILPVYSQNESEKTTNSLFSSELWQKKMKEGVVSFQNRDYSGAEKSFRELLVMNPNDEGVIVLLAKTYLMQGDVDQAFKLLQKAISINPEDANAYQYLAKIYEAMGDFPQSVGALKEYIKYEKNDAFKKGAEDYLNTLTERITYAKSLYANGINFMKEKDYDRALKYFEESYKILPTIPGIHFIFGQIYYEKQDYFKSIQEFLIQLEETPENNALFSSLADSYFRYGDYINAKKYYEKSLENEKNSEDIARLKKMIAESDTIINDIEQKKSKADYNVLLEKGYAYYQKNLFHMAYSHFNLALEKAKKAQFSTTLERHKMYTEIVRNLVVVLVKLHKNDEAVNVAQEHLNNLGNIENPDKTYIGIVSESLEIFGKALYFDKKYKNCADTMKKCIIINPASDTAYYYIALMDIKRNDFQGAKSGLKKVVELNPNFADAYYNLAMIYQNEDLDMAMKYIEKYMELTKNSDLGKQVYDSFKARKAAQ